MAATTRRPSRTSSRIMAAPSYEGVASGFASQFSAAIRQERNAKLDNMVTSYLDGAVTFNELKSFIENYVKEVGQNTSDGASALSQIVKLQSTERDRKRSSKRSELEAKYATADNNISAEDRFKIEQEMLGLEEPGSADYTKQQQNVITSFDNYQTEAVGKRRIELLDKYMGGGITPQEELAIIRELQTVAHPDSSVYAKLVEEEAKIVTTIANTKNTSGLTNDLDFMAADAISQLDNLNRQHQLGLVDGLTRAETEIKQYQELYDAMVKMANQGIAIDRGLLTQVQKGLTFAQEKKQNYMAGALIDVVTKDGSVRTITIDGRDIETGKTADYLNNPVVKDSVTGLYSVVDENGNVVEGGGSHVTEEAAIKAARDLGYVPTFEFIARGNDNQMTMGKAGLTGDGTLILYGQGPGGEDLMASTIPARMDLIGTNPIFQPQVTGKDVPQIVKPFTDVAQFTDQLGSVSKDPLMQWGESMGILPKRIGKEIFNAGETTEAQRRMGEVLKGQNISFDKQGNVLVDGKSGPSNINNYIKGSDLRLPNQPVPTPTPTPAPGQNISSDSLKQSLKGLNVDFSPLGGSNFMGEQKASGPQINFQPISTPKIDPIDIKPISMPNLNTNIFGPKQATNISSISAPIEPISSQSQSGPSFLSKLWSGIKGFFGKK